MLLDRMRYIYEKLEDDRSKETFLKRLEWIIEQDDFKLLEWVSNTNSHISIPELDIIDEGNSEEYLIFGAGKDGRKTFTILVKSGRKVRGFVDNNWKCLKEVCGKHVYSPKELVSSLKNYRVIISSREYVGDIYSQLLRMGLPREQVVFPQAKYLLGFVGTQYFDFFELSDNEVFIDAGAWHGETTLEFAKKCSYKYKKIYLFEPDESCWEACKETIIENKLENVDFISKGTWNKNTTLSFAGSGIGNSTLNEQYTNCQQVEVTTIDEILDGSEVTFIKMDVEGAEMETLQGSARSIKKFKPKLAVCVYHRSADLWELAEYILKLNPDYKLGLRHYSTCSYETVLYAY